MRSNRLPVAPPPLRSRVHSPSGAPRESSLDRVRRLAREHRATEKPFDPERRGSWKGSSRDLVVNPAHGRKGDRHGHDTIVGDEPTFLVIEEDRQNSYGKPTEWLVVNPLDVPRSRYAKEILFAFRLGAYGDSCFLVWAPPDHYDDAATLLAEWCEQYAPGYLTSEEDVAKLMEEVREEDPEIDDEEAYTKATADLTYTESGYFTSYEMQIDQLSDGELFKACEEACNEEYVAEYGEDAP